MHTAIDQTMKYIVFNDKEDEFHIICKSNIYICFCRFLTSCKPLYYVYICYYLDV